MGVIFNETLANLSSRYDRMLRLQREANTNDLRILEATYGAQGWNWLNKDPIVDDVTAILNSMVKAGRLDIPRGYNAIFGDPMPGVKKQLIINFTYKGQLGYTFVDEDTEIHDLVRYVRDRELGEHQAEAEYEWEGRRPAHLR